MKAQANSLAQKKTTVSQALFQKNLFMTGVTGYLGKIVLAKIITHISDIGSISVLIRAADKKEAYKRFTTEVMTAGIFDEIKHEMPEKFYHFCQNKVNVIPGDLSRPDFGLSPIEFNRLCTKTDAIIHSAATLKFHEELEKSMTTNALCMYSMGKLSKQSAAPLVHVSTCFVNGFNNGIVPEHNHHPAKRIPKNLVTLSKDGYYEVKPLIKYLQDRIDKIKPKASSAKELSRELVKLGIKVSRQYGWNDAYTLSKWIGEQIIRKELQGRSLSIVRPAVIGSTHKEPVSGWIEGIKVTDVLIMGYVLGKLKIFPAIKKAPIDIIPGDLVANSAILALADMIGNPGRHETYQCSSSCSNPITVNQLSDFCYSALQGPQRDIFDLVRKPFPKYKPIWTFRFPMINWVRLKRVINFIQNKLATKLGPQAVSKMQRKNRRLENEWNTLDVFSFYTRPRYVFENKNLIQMHQTFDLPDQKLFPVDPKGIDWKQYTNYHVYGLKTYVIKREILKKREEAPSPPPKEIKMAS